MLLTIMEWGLHKNPVAVVGLKECGMKRIDIFRIMRPFGVTRNFVYCSVKLF